ncbi:MAG: cytidine deaminase [Candidatus Eisenbacteria bacterium]
MDDRHLIELAGEAREHAYAPYSGVKVGAAVLTGSGDVYSASNVENASYGLTICAERAALFAAVAAGHRKITKLAIVAEGMESPMPCGACLQVMKEFEVEAVIIAGPDGKVETYELSSLLPRPFRL